MLELDISYFLIFKVFCPSALPLKLKENLAPVAS